MVTHLTYHEPGPNTHTVIVGPAPTREEVLGTNTDLQSKEEIEGGQVLNGAEAVTLHSLLWEAAGKVGHQHEHTMHGFLE